MVDLDDLHAELAEIDENLMRAELTQAQEAAAISRRKAIYEELHPETKAGAFQGNQHTGKVVGDNLSFTAATAKATGKDTRSIERAASRGKTLGEHLEAIVGTSLDKGVELDALAKLSASERQGLIERAVAGEVVSARPLRVEPTGAQSLELSLPAPDGQTTGADSETDLALTSDEWATLGDFLRRIVARENADLVAGGDCGPVESERIERFNEIHGARIFAREAFEFRLSYWALDMWEREFRVFQKAEAKAARSKRASR